MKRSAEEIRKAIIDKKFWIYGAGGHGKKVYKIAERNRCECNFKGFTVSRSENAEYPEICEISRNELILIAAHRENSGEMETKLQELGFGEYFVLYPYITELFWGEPWGKSIEVNVKCIIRKAKKINYLCALFAGGLYACGKSKLGKSIYCKTMRMFSDERTVEKRWDAFLERVNTYNDEGYNPDHIYPIQIDKDNGFILDGAHRLVLAALNSREVICADCYNVDVDEFEYFYNDTKYEDNVFRELFTLEELAEIDYIKEVLTCDGKTSII